MDYDGFNEYVLFVKTINTWMWGPRMGYFESFRWHASTNHRSFTDICRWMWSRNRFSNLRHIFDMLF